MSSLINEELRLLVAYRADHLCEYCLIHESDGLLDFQVDHIISRKHGGATEAQNLAYAWPFCNRQKGSDLGTIMASSRKLIRFFNPRNDKWPAHFKLNVATIEPLSEIAEGTIRILGFNHPDRLLERQLLISIGRYPSIPALARLRI
jgi:hypothetical protein